MPILLNAGFEAIVGLAPPEAPLLNAWQEAESAVNDMKKHLEDGFGNQTELLEAALMKLKVAHQVTKSPPMLRNFKCSIFSVCLREAAGSDGVIIWNDHSALESPNLFWRVPVIGESSWTARLTGAGLDYRAGSPKSIGCEDGCSAILDTGSSVLGLPAFIVDRLSEAVEALDDECSNMHVLPELAFELGGARLSLPPDSYIADMVGQTPQFLQAEGRQPPDQRRCRLMVVETGSEGSAGPLWVLGMPFFRKYYTTFSLGRNLSDRALFFAPHTQDTCRPQRGPGFPLPKASTPLPQPVRQVTAERIQLSLVAQTAISSSFVRL